MAESRPTKLQMKTLVELLSNDPKLSAGKFSANFTKKIVKARWEEIATELNSLPGSEKSWDKWKKAWQDTRATAKNKAAAIKRHINGTGSSPASNVVMSEAQLDSIPLMSQVAISGHLNSYESAVTFSYDKPDETENYGLEDLQDFNNQTYGTITNDVDEIKNSPKLLVETEQEELQLLKSLPKSKCINSEPTRKNQSASERLLESNKAAFNMIKIASQKLKIKSNYYDQKLLLMRENNKILGNINTLVATYLENDIMK